MTGIVISVFLVSSHLLPRLVDIRIHMRMISTYPSLDREAFSLLFTHFRESLFEVWERRISIWLHIDDREDDFIYDITIEKF